MLHAFFDVHSKAIPGIMIIHIFFYINVNATNSIYQALKALKVKSKDKKDADKERRSSKKSSAAKENAAELAVSSRSSGTVVQLINCSGREDAVKAATAQLKAAGFTVVNGGSGDVIAETKVVSNTNNGAVISRLSNIPFAHKMSIIRDGNKDIDGVIMLGQDYN